MECTRPELQMNVLCLKGALSGLATWTLEVGNFLPWLASLFKVPLCIVELLGVRISRYRALAVWPKATRGGFWKGAGRQLNRLLSLSNLRVYCEQTPRSNAHMSKLLRATAQTHCWIY
jgi:hypothetical protein